jgi:excisionase family DNA binding protein
MKLRAVLDPADLRALVIAEVERLLAQQPKGSPWLTRGDAAAYVHLSVRTFDRHVRQGRVRVEYVGTRPLFHRDDLDEYVRGVRP